MSLLLNSYKKHYHQLCGDLKVTELQLGPQKGCINCCWFCVCTCMFVG